MTGWSCLPARAASSVSGNQFCLRYHRSWLLLPAVLTKGHKIDVFMCISAPIFLKFTPRASLVDTEMTSGRPFRMWAFAAISTGVSVIPAASFARELPVQGAMIMISKKFLRAHRLRLGNGADSLFPCNLCNLPHKIFRFSKACITLQRLIRKHRRHIRPISTSRRSSPLSFRGYRRSR